MQLLRVDTKSAHLADLLSLTVAYITQACVIVDRRRTQFVMALFAILGTLIIAGITKSREIVH